MIISPLFGVNNNCAVSSATVVSVTTTPPLTVVLSNPLIVTLKPSKFFSCISLFGIVMLLMELVKESNTFISRVSELSIGFVNVIVVPSLISDNRRLLNGITLFHI